MQNQKDGKLTINNIIIGVNNKEILVEKLKRDILEQKNKYKISEYIIIEMEKDEETITYNTTEEFKDVYTEIVLPNTIISFDPFMLEKTIENVLKKQENEIYKEIEENILKSKYPSKKEKDYITSLTLKMNKKYLNRTYRRYLNLMPYYELSDFIIRDGETFNNMPYASQELIFNENPHALREILEDEEKYNIMYKNRSKILKFGGYFKSLQDFIKCNNGIRGKLEKLRIDEYGRKIPVIIYIEDEYTWYYYIEEFLNGLDKLYIEKEKIKKLIEDNNKKEDIGIVIEVYKYMMENYIIDKGYNKYLNITNYDELLYNELKESSTSQGICRINKNYGICSALSTIFKELLSTFNIENEIIYGYITDEEEKFRHQWNSVKICNNLYIIDILIGLEELEKIEKDLEKMEFIHVLNNNDIKYNYGFLLRKRTD